MFENPGGKLKIIIKVLIYLGMAASVISLGSIFLDYDEGGFFLWLILSAIAVFIWWILGLIWLMWVDLADNVHKIKEHVKNGGELGADMFRKNVQENEENVPVKTVPKPVGSPVKKEEPKVILDTPESAKVIYCPACGKSQFAGNKRCFSCNTPLR